MKLPALPPFSFGSNDRIMLGRKAYRYRGISQTHYHFYEVEDSGAERSIAIKDLPALIDKPRKFRRDADYYSVSNTVLRAENAVSLGELTPEQSALVSTRYAMVVAYERILGTLELTLVDRKKIAVATAFREIADAFVRRPVRSKLSLRVEPVSVDTIERWQRTLRAHGGNPMCLHDRRWRNSGNFDARFTAEEETWFRAAIEDDYLTKHAPSVKQVHTTLKATIDQNNLQRVARGEVELACLGYKSLEVRIRKLPRFVKVAAREGLEAAKKYYREANGGLDYLRPGERLEVDGWYSNLYTLVEGTEFAKSLDEATRKRIKKMRITIIVVICVATRSIVGINFSATESAAAIQAALRMSLMDKSDIAAALGCESPWVQHGHGGWFHDRALAYSVEELTIMVLKSMDADKATVPGVPWLRGVIEAFFRTISSKLLSHLLGQTGSNPIARTEYQSAEYAVVTADELMKLIVQFIVDEYHITTHPELGISPLAAWVKFCHLDPPPPRHGPVEMIEIFGIQQTRRIHHTGIEIAGGQFNSPQLQMLRKLVGSKAQEHVTTWTDYENLGQILVKIDDRLLDKVDDHVDGWLLVPGPIDFEDKGLRLLILLDEDMQLDFGIDPITSKRTADRFRVAAHEFGAQSALQRLSHKPMTLDFVENLMTKTWHFRFGDDDFLAEMDALHVPFRPAAGGTDLDAMHEISGNFDAEASQFEPIKFSFGDDE